jgi:uncharacterized LabA/DUF88 family protein
MANVAILVDGGFYRKRHAALHGKLGAEDFAKKLVAYCNSHLGRSDTLYRIFYYDCPPIKKVLVHPLSGKQEDFSKSKQKMWFDLFVGQMIRERKVALRMGRLAEEHAGYIIPVETTKKLCGGSVAFEDLKDADFRLDVKQKGVDMMIGVDIASLAYKKQTDKIILIAGDSDFVPASKLARREGVDFVLDSMNNHINLDLYEHIDGLVTQCE